ncbi:hypothetical protein BC830DRAFT_1163127 [Chytriomyces sp. MP71]|nr:hypothetical protein BC830DRAFT_1163127 [Chytriomyces sp. MP71]
MSLYASILLLFLVFSNSCSLSRVWHGTFKIEGFESSDASSTSLQDRASKGPDQPLIRFSYALSDELFANLPEKYRHKRNETVLHLKTADTGCPTPKAALIGILSEASLEKSARRNYLRRIYTNAGRGLPHDQQIDFVYVFGATKASTSRYQLDLERYEFPGDMLVTDRVEGRDDGKILDWLFAARNLSLIPHPSRPEKWCRAYRWIGKGDDDALIHVPKLANMLKGLPQNETQYIGRQTYRGFGFGTHMTGMLYLLTVDLAEWVVQSDIPKTKLSGVEDVQLGKWIWDGKVRANWIDVQEAFHNLPEAEYFQKRVSNSSVVVHWCKNTTQFFKCVKYLYHPDPVTILTRDHELFNSIPALTDKLQRQFGIKKVYWGPARLLQTNLQHDLASTQSMSVSALEDRLIAFLLNPWIQAHGVPLRGFHMRDLVRGVREAARDRWFGEDVLHHALFLFWVHTRGRALGMHLAAKEDEGALVTRRALAVSEWTLRHPREVVSVGVLDEVLIREGLGTYLERRGGDMVPKVAVKAIADKLVSIIHERQSELESMDGYNATYLGPELEVLMTDEMRNQVVKDIVDAERGQHLSSVQKRVLGLEATIFDPLSSLPAWANQPLGNSTLSDSTLAQLAVIMEYWNETVRMEE